MELVIYDIVSSLTNLEFYPMKHAKKEFAQTLGKRVREVRKYRGFTLEKLALDAEIELKQLSRIEHGQINTSVFQIYRLCYSLNLDMKDLFESIPLRSITNQESNHSNSSTRNQLNN